MEREVTMTTTPDYTQLYRFDGRCVVVLGGGDGIGQETCHALAGLGARVVVVDRDETAAIAVANRIGGLPLAADVTERRSVQGALEKAEREVGPVRHVVDIVGVALTGRVLDSDDDLWDRQYSVVLKHAVLALQLAGPRIRAAGGGSMVFVGSTSGIAYTPGQVVYGTAKAALHHLVHTAARELAGDSIRINAVAPGYTRTPRLEAKLGKDAWNRIDQGIPRGRAGVASEVAAPIAFLLSDAASYVTGQVLLADGGISGIVPSYFT